LLTYPWTMMMAWGEVVEGRGRRVQMLLHLWSEADRLCLVSGAGVSRAPGSAVGCLQARHLLLESVNHDHLVVHTRWSRRESTWVRVTQYKQLRLPWPHIHTTQHERAFRRARTLGKCLVAVWVATWTQRQTRCLQRMRMMTKKRRRRAAREAGRQARPRLDGQAGTGGLSWHCEGEDMKARRLHCMQEQGAIAKPCGKHVFCTDALSEPVGMCMWWVLRRSMGHQVCFHNSALARLCLLLPRQAEAPFVKAVYSAHVMLLKLTYVCTWEWWVVCKGSKDMRKRTPRRLKTPGLFEPNKFEVQNLISLALWCYNLAVVW